MPSNSTAIEKTCTICGTTYRVKRSSAGSSKYCSRACQGVAKRTELRRRVGLICAQCGNSFEVRSWAARTQRFCSYACMGTAQKGVTRSVPILKACEVCGAEFRVKAYRSKTQRFCSRPCYWVARTGTTYHRAPKYTESRSGYVYVYQPDHPAAMKSGYVAEHRLVAEATLGRPLEPHEIVHHRDRNGGNNAPENLQVMTQPEHAALHKTEGW